MASAARSGEAAEASAMEARRGRDATGGSMRSTRARSGIAGDAQNLGSVETHPLKRVEPQTRLHAFPQIRRNAHLRNRLYDEARKRKTVRSYIRKSAGIAPASGPGRPDAKRPARSSRALPTAQEDTPPKGGVWGDDQSPLLRDQIRLCAPSSPSTRRA